jgi:hypothetical protein
MVIHPTNANVGYFFYNDRSDGDLKYRKSTNLNAALPTWSAPVVIHAGANTVSCFTWPDWYTPGDSGTKIHILYMDDGVDDVFYRSLDISTDTLDTERTVFAGTTLTNSCLSITKTRGGNLLAAWDSNSTDRGAAKSTDGGTTWAPITSPIEADANDQCTLYPANLADANDAWAIYFDVSASEYSLKTWDDSAGTWSEVALYSGVTFDFFNGAYSGAVRHSDGHLIFAAYTTQIDQATNDFAIYDIANAGSITQKTNPITNMDDWGAPRIFVNQANNDLYACYVGKADGSETWASSINFYFKKSTDGGSTWGTETLLTDAANTSMGFYFIPPTGRRLIATWMHDDFFLTYSIYTNGPASLDLTPASGTTYTKSGLAASAAVVAGTSAKSKNYTKTGAGVAPAVASGSKTREKSRLGAAIIGTLDGYGSYEGGYAGVIGNGLVVSGTSTKTSNAGKTGSAVTALSASGTDQFTATETGAAISAAAALGAGDAVRNKSGSMFSEGKLSGIKIVTYAEMGTGIAVLVASGSDTEVRGESGTVIAALVAIGSDEHTAVRAGTATSPVSASAADTHDAIRAGTGVVGLAATGIDSHENVDAGSASSGLSASGADVHEAVEAGAGIVGAVAAGQSLRLQPGKAGQATSEAKASGADASEHSESGAAVASLSTAGADAHTAGRTGMVIATADFSGPKALVRVESGTPTSEAKASGADTTTYVEAGAGISPLSVQGSDSAEHAETGTPVSPLSASGTKSAERSAEGTASTEAKVSGSDQSTFVESGAAVAVAVASAFRNLVANRAGGAVVDAIVSGVQEFVRRLRGGTLDMSHDHAHVDMSEQTAQLDLVHESCTVEMREEVRK